MTDRIRKKQGASKRERERERERKRELCGRSDKSNEITDVLELFVSHSSEYDRRSRQKRASCS